MGYVISPSGGGALKVADSAARLALSPADGDLVIQLDTDVLYTWDATSSDWVVLGGAGVGGILSINGLTDGAHTIAMASTQDDVNEPTWVSTDTGVSDTHELKIPLASTGTGVTRGAISGTEYSDIKTKLDSITSPFLFKGEIAAAADFPTSAAVQAGWLYTITADVTDNDVTKTNTGSSFDAGQEIAWDGSAWVEVGNRDHNTLMNMQGGAVGEYYHLTEQQRGLVTGLNPTLSPSRLSAITVTDNGDGTVTTSNTLVSLLNATSGAALLDTYALTAITSGTLTTNAKYLLVADYNSGSPIMEVRPLLTAGVNRTTIIPLGLITRGIGGDCYWLDFGRIGVNTGNKLIGRLNNINGLLVKTSGGIVSSSAGRYLQITEGEYFQSIEKITVSALDTTGTDRFSRIYGDSTAGFTEVTGQSQIDNANYWNTSTNTLTALSSGRYSLRWVFQLIDNPDEVYVWIGTSQHTTIAAARATLLTTDLPVQLQQGMENTSVLIARVLVQEGQANVIGVEQIVNVNTQTVSVSDHAELANLNSATYSHVTAAQLTDLTDAGDSTLHYHASDRARANHTGTQLAATISDFSTTVNGLSHNSKAGLQGGTTNEYYHFTAAQHADLTDAGDSTLHYHASDRARANHSGTQLAATISDFSTTVNELSHNSKAGLQGGTTNEYYHFTAAQHADLTDAGDSTLHYHASDRARANHTGTQLAATISDFSTTVNGLSHNSKSGLQGGTTSQYYHMTSDQHTIATQAASVTVAGYVSTGTQVFAGVKTFSGDAAPIRLQTNSAAASGVGILSYYAGTTATRLGFLGMGSGTNANMLIVSDNDAVNIQAMTDFILTTNSSTRMTVNSAGEFGVNTIPVATLKFLIKGSGTTNSSYSIFCRNSSDANMFYITDAGNAWVAGNMSVLSFTDRTPYPYTLQTAIDAVNSMEKLPDGEYDHDNKEHQLDHSKLHPYVSSGEYRDMSASVSCINEVVKHLLAENAELKAQLAEVVREIKEVNNALGFETTGLGE